MLTQMGASIIYTAPMPVNDDGTSSTLVHVSTWPDSHGGIVTAAGAMAGSGLEALLQSFYTGYLCKGAK